MNIQMLGSWGRAGILLAMVATSAGSGQAQSAADQRSVREVLSLFTEFNRAWERRDSAFISRYYAHDTSGAFFFERRQLTGWPRVDTLYRNMFANAARGTVRSTSDVLDVGARGNVAWLAANFRLEVTEPSGITTVDEGRQSLVFERRAGRWVVVHRHTSFQAPPGPQRPVPLHRTPGPLWSPADDTTGGLDARVIRSLREQSNVAIARHDTAGIAAILAPHVVVVTSNSRTFAGRDAMIRSFAEQFASSPEVWYRRTPLEVKVFDAWGMASEEGRWTGAWTDPDGPLTIGGIYFAKWRMLDGRWLVESETYVPDRCSGGQYCQASPARP